MLRFLALLGDTSAAAALKPPAAAAVAAVEVVVAVAPVEAIAVDDAVRVFVDDVVVSAGRRRLVGGVDACC